MEKIIIRLIFTVAGLLFFLNTIECVSLRDSRLKYQNETIKIRTKRFICPKDGKWPDETDCGKYHNCDGASVTTGWCGPSMSFDVDNQRCEMALAINCKEGDRPDWKPPDNWNGKTKETTTTTKKSTATTKANNSGSGSTTKLNDPMKEKDKCSFKGLIPDKENCASYFYCKDNEARKETCADRQLFDEESKSCKEYKDVYCGERPVNDKDKDQCRTKPNGVYPNFETGCSDFFQCSNQRKVKIGECPKGLKFNMMTLRCDWPTNVPVPCGTKSAGNSAQAIFKSKLNLLILLIINTALGFIYK